MKKTYFLALFLSFFFLEKKASAQVLFFSDLGNNILARPNLGLEYRLNKNAFFVSGQWQRNYLRGCEFPGLQNSNGIRADFGYKYFITRILFFETKLRLQKVQSAFYEGDKYCSFYAPFKTFEPVLKFGFTTSPKKIIQSDLSFGFGSIYRRWYNPNFVRSFKTEKGLAPHLQIKLYILPKKSSK